MVVELLRRDSIIDISKSKEIVYNWFIQSCLVFKVTLSN